MIVDTHCHIFKEYYEDIEKVIKEAKDNNIIMIVNGINLSTNLEVINLTKKYENVYGVLGYHPSEVSYIEEKDFITLEEQLKHEKIIGIGEIGLDYYWTKENKVDQINLFVRQLEIAQKYNYPIIVHNRSATENLIEVLSDFKLKGIIHAFSNTEEISNIYTKLGYKLGIGGVVTFKNSTLKTVLENIDVENIVFETDSPYLTPEPKRGKINYPTNIKYIIAETAKIKQISEQEMISIAYKNTLDIFDLEAKK